jgi:hypothetical protein
MRKLLLICTFLCAACQTTTSDSMTKPVTAEPKLGVAPGTAAARRATPGDFDRAQRLLNKYGVANDEINSVNAKLTDIPVDIRPVFPAARGEMT